MSRLVVLGLTLLVGGLVVLVLWWTPTGRAGESIELLCFDAEADEPFARAAVEPLASLPVEEGAASEAGAVPTAQRSEPPDERPHISGTVRLPHGILAQEAVKVRVEVLPAAGNGGPRKFSAPIASDGSFTLVVPADTQYAKLGLESRFLVLPKSVRARPGATDVVLEPRVYAAIVGEVVPPLALATTGASWADMSVSWSFATGLKRNELQEEDVTSLPPSPTQDEPVRPDDGGAFVLAFVPAGVEFELHAKNPFGPEWFQRIGPLEPAELRNVTIALELGITISGSVIDEHGQPVAGVRISTDAGALASLPWNRESQDVPRSDPDGRFELTRLPRRVTRVSTTESDFLQDAAATVDGSAGDVHDVVLAVVRGGCIEGTLAWPDRSPVDQFQITAAGRAGAARSFGQAGRFRLPGLNDGSYRVDARATRGAVAGSVRIDDVRPGAAPLELVLVEARAFELRGVTVDEQGAPVAECSVYATRLLPVYRFQSAEESSDGSFLLGGLEAGEWTVEARGSGYQLSSQRIVVGESTPSTLRIVLLRSARIRGVVVDPAGQPLPGAWVGEEASASMAEYSGPEADTTDAEGRFEIQPTTRNVRLLAHRGGFSVSEIHVLDVGSGEDVEGLVLRLRAVCKVVGRVLDEHGAPLSGAEVSASGIPFVPRGVVTDTRGTFELDGLPPGATHVSARHPARPGALAPATVTLAPGEVGAVDLRFEGTDPVRVTGRVTRGGAPVECKLWFRTPSFLMGASSRPDGRFEVNLQRPGNWRGAVWLASEEPVWQNLSASDVRRFDVLVPGVEAHAFELDLETLPRLSSMEELER